MGKIGEGLAALGVVVSPLFVGYEIRQNTQLSKAASLEAQAELGAEIAATEALWLAAEPPMRWAAAR